MFCTKCGQQLKDDARFCTNCGTPVPEDSENSPQQWGTAPPAANDVPTASPPVYPTAPVTHSAPPAAQPVSFQGPAASPKKSRAPMVMAVAVLLVAALGALWWFYLRDESANDSAGAPAPSQQGDQPSGQEEQEGQPLKEEPQSEPDSEKDVSDLETDEAEPAAISDYAPYAGSYASTDSAEDYFQNGGPLVELSVEGSSLYYTVSSASASCYRIAELSGSAPLDGSPDVAFYGSDSWGNTISGTIHLLAGGAVAVEAAVTEANAGAEWSLSLSYRELIPCGSSFTAVQAPDSTQELVVTSSGSTATMTLRNWNYGQWTDVFTADAYIGSNGVTEQKREGDKATPAGTFQILFAFGTAERELSIPYIQVRSGDVWVGDTSSYYYNTMQSGSGWSSSENLYDKFTKNRSVACIYFDFNGDGRTGGSATPDGGSDLFIDGVGSSGNLTSGYGDIKISGSDMLALLPLLDSSRNPVVVIS